jgi:hypothetical protein
MRRRNPMHLKGDAFALLVGVIALRHRQFIGET